ncbi:urease accessory protein UreD [Gluconobacter oxydans]|uniref:urease accessory protein UreD n=1 Tax=Gluconobacter oxydans TaxID=442 RepID=UPI001CD87BA2|nr:urease accessory protein UreD [Gluconobacter oxydans]
MSTAVLQRARGWFGLTAKLRDGQTVRGDLEQGGCCRLLFPRVDGASLEAVTVNISGGIAGGDRIEGCIACAPDTELLVTSQAAERIYRARASDIPPEILTSCHIAAGARLDWLPHGTIFFDGSQLRRNMTVDMEASSSFLFLESRMFGRTGSGEILQTLALRDRLTIRRDGRLILEDLVRLESDDVSVLMTRKAVSADQLAVATLVLVSPLAEARLDAVRDVLDTIVPHEFAASAWNGMLVIRGVASGGWSLEKTIRQILPVLRDGRPMPATWRS